MKLAFWRKADFSINVQVYQKLAEKLFGLKRRMQAYWDIEGGGEYFPRKKKKFSYAWL